MSEIQIRSTGTTEVVQSSDGRITLSVPIQIKRRSGRPAGHPNSSSKGHSNSPTLIGL
jgi:hypothetical protein